MVKNLTGFAGARQRALIGVPDTLVTGGDLRRDTFRTPNTRRQDHTGHPLLICWPRRRRLN